ncbi:MAG TPA: hypothetical protein VFN35_18980 [Ktedonobacteraceae bacterium]|nr:hypothetical protein [Ktedonobacteraceae bacterium]
MFYRPLPYQILRSIFDGTTDKRRRRNCARSEQAGAGYDKMARRAYRSSSADLDQWEKQTPTSCALA